jgi:hypothetical protein
MSWREIMLLSRVASSPDTLATWQRTRQRPAPLTDERTATALGDLVDDGYAIGTEALIFLDARVRQERPRAIVELGSGMSTVGLAACMASLHSPKGPPYVFSIDEDAGYLERTRKMLERAGLSARVRLAHRPVREQTVLGHRTRCYEIEDRFLRDFLVVEPDFVLIDGPSGGGDVRFGTLPLLLSHLRRPCRVYLDDALRADEMRIASLWRRIPGFEVDGIHLVGDGVLEGRLS